MLNKLYPAICIVAILILICIPRPAETKEPGIVILGTTKAVVDFYKSKDFWGPLTGEKTLSVPRVIVIAVNDNWKQDAEKLSVGLKKKFFFLALIPMILYENRLILADRSRLKALAEQLMKGRTLKEEDLKWLWKLALKYRLASGGNAEGASTSSKIKPLMGRLMKRVDIVPPSLAIGQAALESGYGTSRFALEGNAFFGQWTYSGKGIKAKKYRKEKGNYRVEAFDWPFESLCAYVNNLNTHRSYSAFRAKRAALRKEHKPLTGLVLAYTLAGYSERGANYVKELKNIIRKNRLATTDTAKLRDDPLTLVVYVNTQDDVAKTKKEFEQMRASGELAKTIKSMGLED